MLKKFKFYDEKNTGFVNMKNLRAAMSRCELLTPKEINVILRSFKSEETAFEYKYFDNLLFDTRFELARSRLMDTSLNKITEHLEEQFAAYDPNKTGLITITEIKKALFNSKMTNLTPMQVFTLIGMSKPDSNAQVNYHEFAV